MLHMGTLYLLQQIHALMQNRKLVMLVMPGGDLFEDGEKLEDTHVISQRLSRKPFQHNILCSADSLTLDADYNCRPRKIAASQSIVQGFKSHFLSIDLLDHIPGQELLALIGRASNHHAVNRQLVQHQPYC